MKRKKKIVSIKAFRQANTLYQRELADYLGVSVAFISAAERGQAKLPDDKLELLVKNDRGWDTSTLIQDAPSAADERVAPATFSNMMGAYGDLNLLIFENNRLKEENERLKRDVEYWEERYDRLLGLLEDKFDVKA